MVSEMDVHHSPATLSKDTVPAEATNETTARNRVIYMAFNVFSSIPRVYATKQWTKLLNKKEYFPFLNKKSTYYRHFSGTKKVKGTLQPTPGL
jgi:hypothetical protein